MKLVYHKKWRLWEKSEDKSDGKSKHMKKREFPHVDEKEFILKWSRKEK